LPQLADSFDWSPGVNSIIKFIPKSSRNACATSLASTIRAVVDHPADLNRWLSLLNWARDILSLPTRTGKKVSIASTIIKRTASTPTAAPLNCVCIDPPDRCKNGGSLQLSKLISSKVEEGNISGAVRFLMSDDSIAVVSSDNLTKLQSKHPDGSYVPGPLSVEDISLALCVTEAEVRSAIASFPAGSSGGPDGLRPQHLKVLTGCKISGPELTASLTALVNLLLAGKCPCAVAKCFFGGKLIAIKKDNGDVRPIVIGFVMRRLASKLANSFGLTRISSSLCPTQIGAGVKGGCEAAIHATRRFVEDMSEDDVIVKLDFRNAFNSLHRDDIFKEVQKIYLSFCHMSTPHMADQLY